MADYTSLNVLTEENSFLSRVPLLQSSPSTTLKENHETNTASFNGSLSDNSYLQSELAQQLNASNQV